MNDFGPTTLVVSPDRAAPGPAPELRHQSYWSDKMGWEALVPGGWSGLAGIAATPRSALGLAAYFACINVIATDVASLNLRLYRRLPGGGREELRDDRRWDLVDCSPDGETTSIQSRQAYFGHVLGWDNGLYEIEVDRAERPLGLHLLEPTTRAYRDPTTKRLEYRVPDGTTLPAKRVVHVAGFGYDGLCGYTVAQLLRGTIELGLGAQRAGESFFEKGLRPSGALESPYTLKDEAAVARLKASVAQSKAGSGNFGSFLLLEGGAKWNPMSINPRDAQFLETRQFQVLEIARIFRVFPHMIMDNSQVQLASAGLEAMNDLYKTTTLTSWCKKAEQQLDLKLLTREERAAGHYFRHDFRNFLRGDPKVRGEFYERLRGLGALSPNEIRELEELNPIPKGDEYVRPANLVPLGYQPQRKAAAAPAPAAQQGDADASQS